MRIVIVNNFAYVTGGADHHCFALARALRKRGHQVAFLSTESTSNEETGGEFVSCSVTNSTRDALPASRRVGVAARAIWNRECAAALGRLLEGFRPDVVHLHKMYPQLSVAPAVLAARSVPVVQTLHDYELAAASAFDHRGGRLDRHESRASYRLLNTLTYPLRRHLHARLVDRFVAVSDSVANTYAEHGIEAVVLPNFVEDEAGADALALERPREGILFAGRLSDEKGVLDVLELARRLPDTPVTIAGDGPLAGTVAAEARRLGNLRFRGQLDHPVLRESMRSAQLLVTPSRWDEPASLVALEAMRGGTPVVGYDRGGLAEYVRRANAGILVESDVGRLAEACRALQSRPDVWQRYSRAGPRAVRRFHSPERYLPRIEAVYREAMRGAGAIRRRRGGAPAPPAAGTASNGRPRRSIQPPPRGSSESRREPDALAP